MWTTQLSALARPPAICPPAAGALPPGTTAGYTNAGKSSLVTALSGSDVGAADQLFATLDPTLRRIMLPSGRDVILSDTVGFISDLPVQLVEAFQVGPAALSASGPTCCCPAALRPCSAVCWLRW